MKHSYTVGCECKRCTRELARRTAQSNNERARQTIHNAIVKVRRRKAERKPVYGSQEWAETYSDDLGESEDR